MRSLWRMIALRWLGGQGSGALTDDSALLDLLTSGERAPPIGFAVSRRSLVSHRAINSREAPGQAAAEPVTVGKSGGDRLP
jgi:hypothetical protein